MNLKIIPLEFYQTDTVEVAQRLLGKILAIKLNNQKKYFKIVETEAYLGLQDPAAHSFHGKRTPRVLPMYQMGGTVYVYLIYGLHLCLNIVTRPEGVPEAVLIRALEPLTSFDKATNGPGRIGQALELSLNMNGEQVFSKMSPIQIYENLDEIKKPLIKSTPRVGIDSHQEAKRWLLRFFIDTNPFVSKGRYFRPSKNSPTLGKGGID